LLLVGRFDPLAAKAPQAASAASRKRPEVEPAAPVTAVDPTFARVFRGGPQREKSFLPVGEDEGKEVTYDELVPVPEQDDEDDEEDQDAASACEQEGDAEEAAEAAGEAAVADPLGWLSSIGASAAAPSGSSKRARVEEAADPSVNTASSSAATTALRTPAPLSEAAQAIVGKALDIPPFHRTAPLWQLERDLRRRRPALLLSMRNFAHDARRVEKNRGQFRFKPGKGGGRGH